MFIFIYSAALLALLLVDISIIIQLCLRLCANKINTNNVSKMQNEISIFSASCSAALVVLWLADISIILQLCLR